MSDPENSFLDKVYDVHGADQTKALYKDWAASYEAEVTANGYATPTRCAEALAAHAEDLTAPVLDLGCGTGLSGEAMQKAGFTTIDGTDFSEEMLAYAAKKEGLYRRLSIGDMERPLPAAPGDYANIAAIGVFSPSHAPPDIINRTLDLLPKGGCLVFSLNDHALKDPSYEDRTKALAKDGIVDIAFSAYGDHLPGQNIKSMVYVLKKKV